MRNSSTATRGTGPEGAPLPRQVIKFCVLFLVYVVAARVAIGEPAALHPLREHYCAWIAQASRLALRCFGVEAQVVNQAYLGAGGFQVLIAPSCDGLNAMSILAAAILAFPASLRARCWGLLIGLPILVLINIVRVAGLFLVGLHFNRLFEIVHIYAFQVSLIAVAVACFLVWARSVSTGRLARRTIGDEIRA